MLEPVTLTCPYCGEDFETTVDASAGSQAYVEDCPVCCRPIEVGVDVDIEGTIVGVRARSDRE
ncbi:MAG: CPXCG motif-containing cysteine-rich protein [Mizugakiibacter sp.]|uniref:CPXCG motif-containing cysteine-rich protein n=1 Tax=Mizugakiibacter sp. TaxID=1972610 RepID=UPI0031BC876A|nr:CPXCG motif-containing cysteine-rich protein [Xanthomonadaceae bacterium]